MARLDKMHPGMRATLEGLPCPTYESKPWVQGKPLSEMRVAMISSAGIHPRGTPNFAGGEAGYRTIPADIAPGDIVMSHVSVNFDRTGFRQDINTVFPIEFLDELADENTIGSVAPNHYSFMGATAPDAMEDEARTLAKQLRADKVDAAILLPV